MIQWVAEKAMKASSLSRIIVATDDKRIQECVLGFGGECMMTPPEIPSGTDRIAFVVQNLDADIVINIQGDEPLIKPDEIDRVADILSSNHDAVMGTLVKAISHVDDLINPNTVKVVLGKNGNALYFSRIPIPFYRDDPNQENWMKKHTYYKHLGIYAYRKLFLLQFAKWKQTPLEKAEQLEQLRVLENGYPIHAEETHYDPVGVDTAEDLEKVREIAERGENGN